jgi:hypothetical protein
MVPVRYKCTVHCAVLTGYGYRYSLAKFQSLLVTVPTRNFCPLCKFGFRRFLIIFFREIDCLSSNKREQKCASMCLKVTNGGPAPRLATLLLEDGTRFTGTSFGAVVSMAGEVGAVLLALAIFYIYILQ